MLNITTTIAEAVGTKLADTYRHYYGEQEARFATILDAGARLIIERISTSDALYHNLEHTILVTLAMCVACVWETKSKARLLMKLEKGCTFRAVPATRC